MHRMDANPCACESSRSQLSHAQGFRSKPLTVASEYSFEIINILGIISGNSTETTAISSEKLKGESDQMTSFMGERVPCMVRIFVRWKSQGLNFYTHKDLCQNLSSLLQNC